MTATEVQWIGSSCGRHGSYTFYKGFRIISEGEVKNYCLGEFYFVRNSVDLPICIAELQLIWYDASSDSKLASARLYFRPEDTPVGRLPLHGEDELLYADQKVVIKCEDMAQWEYSGNDWTTGLIPPSEADLISTKELCINSYNGMTEEKHKLQESSVNIDSPVVEKITILTFQAYCRYSALKKRLLDGVCFSRSQMMALGCIIAPNCSTRVGFCRESFICPDVDKYHLSGETKAPVLKGRPRKKKFRNAPLAKELKRKRFLADLEHVKTHFPQKKIKLSEDEEGTESDLSEESTKSSESMDEERAHAVVEIPFSNGPLSNEPGLIPVKIVKVVKPDPKIENRVICQNILDKHKVPPPLIPTAQVKSEPTSPPVLQVARTKPEVSPCLKIDTGPPPLCSVTQRVQICCKTAKLEIVPKLLPTSGEVTGSAMTQGVSMTASVLTASGKADIVTVRSSSGSLVTSAAITTQTGISSGPGATSPLGNVDRKGDTDGRLLRSRPAEETGIVKIEGKENLQESNKTKRKRLRQPGNMKEMIDDYADEDEKYFMRSLREFMKTRNTPISKIPALGFKRVNLWTMYNTTQKLGGYDLVTSKRLWRQVYDALGGSPTITSAATYTRRHYERLLLPYERYVRGQLNMKKEVKDPPQPPPQDSQEPKGHVQQTKQTNNKNSIIVNNNNNNCINNAKLITSKNNLIVKQDPPYTVSIKGVKLEGHKPGTVIVVKSVTSAVVPALAENPQRICSSPATSVPGKQTKPVEPCVTLKHTCVTVASTVTPQPTSVVQRRTSLTPRSTSVTPVQKNDSITLQLAALIPEPTSVTPKPAVKISTGKETGELHVVKSCSQGSVSVTDLSNSAICQSGLPRQNPTSVSYMISGSHSKGGGRVETPYVQKAQENRTDRDGACYKQHVEHIVKQSEHLRLEPHSKHVERDEVVYRHGVREKLNAEEVPIYKHNNPNANLAPVKAFHRRSIQESESRSRELNEKSQHREIQCTESHYKFEKGKDLVPREPLHKRRKQPSLSESPSRNDVQQNTLSHSQPTQNQNMQHKEPSRSRHRYGVVPPSEEPRPLQESVKLSVSAHDRKITVIPQKTQFPKDKRLVKPQPAPAQRRKDASQLTPTSRDEIPILTTTRKEVSYPPSRHNKEVSRLTPTQRRDVPQPTPTQRRDVPQPTPTQRRDVPQPTPTQRRDVPQPTPTQRRDVPQLTPTQRKEIPKLTTRRREVPQLASTQRKDVPKLTPTQRRDVSQTTQIKDIPQLTTTLGREMSISTLRKDVPQLTTTLGREISISTPRKEVHRITSQRKDVPQLTSTQRKEVPKLESHKRKDVIDLTENEARSASSLSCNQPMTQASMYVKAAHHRDSRSPVVNSCQRTEARVVENPRGTTAETHEQHSVVFSYNTTRQQGYPEKGHVCARKIDRNVAKRRKSVEHLVSKEEQDEPEMHRRTVRRCESRRTITQHTAAKSPDEHFQEWRRRQGMLAQYPAYVTSNEPERQMKSIVSQPNVPQQEISTPPAEPRYIYIQDEPCVGPRIIEEVPLMLSADSGMYYQDDGFYTPIPMGFHGWMPTSSSADGTAGKVDTDGAHLMSSSCIFMPSSQIFGPSVPMAVPPISPPMFAPTHLMTGPDEVPIHPHCLMTPYPFNHQVVSQVPTRPLHSYT